MKLFVENKLNEYLNDDLLENNAFLSCAKEDLSKMTADEITKYILEASRLNNRLNELRQHIFSLDWWLDNGEDITIREIDDTLSYLEETDYFNKD